MNEIQPVGLVPSSDAPAKGPHSQLVSVPESAKTDSSREEKVDPLKEAGGISELRKVALEIEVLVSEVTDKSVTFSIEDDLSRMVVAVRAVGSDEVIRQFPPEEFLTVAKFIAAQDKSTLSQDFLKGILFNTYS